MKISPLPIILAGAVAVFAFSNKAKKPTPQLPFTITCDSIVIKDSIKTDTWFIQRAQEYVSTLPDLESLSYIKFVGGLLKKLNKECADKFTNQQLNKNEMFIVSIVRDKAEKGFTNAFFGDPMVLQGDDKITYEHFAEIIQPDKKAEFAKYFEWDSKYDQEFIDVKKAINENGRWPL